MQQVKRDGHEAPAQDTCSKIKLEGHKAFAQHRRSKLSQKAQ
jgi:hypothetical protein